MVNRLALVNWKRVMWIIVVTAIIMFQGVLEPAETDLSASVQWCKETQNSYAARRYCQ